ncbi:serine/threonine protein kinase BUD32 [Parastagonospora nodorum]|nr:serine/threonine protein kinase BUD32 [Parastagonospora nodorum]
MASSTSIPCPASTFMLSHAQLAAMEEWAFLTHLHLHRSSRPQSQQSFLQARQHRYPSIPAYNFQATLSTIPPSSLVLFPAWCKAHSLDSGKHTSYAQYLSEVNLLPYEGDPADYPGLYHFVCMIHCGTNRFEGFERKDQMSVRWILNCFYESRYLADFGGLGDVVGGRWRIVATLTNDSGDCNRGIHKVHECATTGPVRLMKVLASEALWPGHSAREIGILATLRGGCANIVQSFDSYTPSGRHDLPWLVMEMCNAQSLWNRAKKYWKAEEDVPELFIWHVFIGLLEAVKYCHYGPGEEDWDPIYHRDITLSNVLLHYPTDDKTVYPVVKLADFGCAVTRSEATAKQLKIADMPEVCPSAIPPEGALADQATDMYQVGTIVKELMEKERNSNGRALVRTYSKKLQYLADCCTILLAAKRPDAASMMRVVRTNRDDLLAAGSVRHERLRGE